MIQATKENAIILQTLAEKLSDRILQECFDDIPPQTVRDVLQFAAQSLSSEGSLNAEEESETLQETVGKKNRTISSKEKLFVFSDGASRGNPGEAGAGVVIFDDQGNEVYAGGRYLGQCTNNVAEYKALLLGLNEVKKLNPEKIELRLDSELIVRQILGVYRVKNETLKPLFSEVMKRLQRFSSFHIEHVPREKNCRADELANQAIDTKDE